MSARSMPVYLDITELYNSSGGDDMSTELSIQSSHSTGNSPLSFFCKYGMQRGTLCKLKSGQLYYTMLHVVKG